MVELRIFLPDLNGGPAGLTLAATEHPDTPVMTRALRGLVEEMVSMHILTVLEGPHWLNGLGGEERLAS